MTHRGREFVIRLTATPRPAELLPAGAGATRSLYLNGTQKTHARVAAEHPNAVNIIIPHTPAMVAAAQELEKNTREPFSEWGTVMIVEVVGQRYVLPWDDMGKTGEIKVQVPHSNPIPADSVLIVRQQFHSYNRERKPVGVFGGAASIPFVYSSRGAVHKMTPVDFSDTEATDEVPDFMARWGSGYPKGTVLLEMPSAHFGLTTRDFVGTQKSENALLAEESRIDDTIYLGVSGIFNMVKEFPQRALRPYKPTYQGTEPMQAPAFRVIDRPGKLPGGAWAMMRMRAPLPSSLWRRLVTFALDRYAHLPMSLGTDLRYARGIEQQRWLFNTVNKQFMVWGPKEQRVHPEFLLACCVVFHAVCMIDTAMWYTDDHTNENSPAVRLDSKLVKVGNNQRLSFEDLTGDCDTFAGSIVRMWEDLIHHEPTGDDTSLLLAARDVARLFVVGMPHSSVSAASVQRETEAKPANHMYALAIPSETFLVMLTHGTAGSSDMLPYKQRLASLLDYDQNRSKYLGAIWHRYLQMMVLEGTGPLVPFPFPGWVSAISTLYAHNPAIIIPEEKEYDLHRAELIALHEQTTLEMEGVLARDSGMISPSMMLYENPLMTLSEFVKSDLKASHFYQVAMGFQTAVLEREDIPVIDLLFLQGKGAGATVGVSYADMVLAPLVWAAKMRGENVDASDLVTLRPSVILEPQEMEIIRRAVNNEPAPDVPEMVQLTDEQRAWIEQIPKKTYGGDMVEVTYFVRAEDLPEFVPAITRLEPSLCHIACRPRPLIRSTTMLDMSLVVVDVQVGVPMPEKTPKCLRVSSCDEVSDEFRALITTR